MSTSFGQETRFSCTPGNRVLHVLAIVFHKIHLLYMVNFGSGYWPLYLIQASINTQSAQYHVIGTDLI